MATYPIPEYLQDSHDGDEWAIVAILGGRVVALRYISDVAPEIGLTESAIGQWLDRNPLELRELKALGSVSAGIVTADGFEVQWELSVQKLFHEFLRGTK
ncbi:hypothetical protein [Bordetella muralis]|uniref:hypothetical protein n=1 Tax=Bordetella muralis TaxID=1649130 RepID=UPI0039F06E60